jgi:NAD(P)-dependent dehydrogenase (short-subunit alcohol dehydrogenase family)
MAIADIRGRTALVTGGARRVGRAICLRLAEEGVNIAFTFLRSASDADETRRELESRGVGAKSIRADLADLQSCDTVISEAAGISGKVDILVNNASEFPVTALGALAEDRERFQHDFQHLADIHMRAPLYLGVKLGLDMKKNGWGRIVNMTDRVIARGQAYSNWILYLVTKYGLYGINQVLAQELAPEVTVNTIAPGLIVPPPDFSGDDAAKIVSNIPLRRMVGTAEIAEDVLFLVRSDSKTGSILLTDGGSGLRTF